MVFPTLDVYDRANVARTVNTLPAAGQAAEADSLSVTWSTENEADVATIKSTLAAIQTLMATAATEVPHGALDKTLDLTIAQADSSSTSDQTIVTATSGQTTRVHRMVLTSAAAVEVTFYDGASPTTKLAAPLLLPAAGIWVIPFDTRPYLITSANTALVMKLGSAVRVSATFWYAKSA